MFTNRTDEIFRQNLTLVLISTDAAPPDGLSFFCFFSFRLRFDFAVVIIVSCRRYIREYLHCRRQTDKRVCDPKSSVCCTSMEKISICTDRYIIDSVFGTNAFLKSLKLVDISSGLKSESFKYVKETSCEITEILNLFAPIIIS